MEKERGITIINVDDKKQCDIHVVMCSACGEKIPEHEKNIEHLSRMTKSELEDVECISCEIKYRDSADIDNFG
jgi:hypothetical protein